MVIVIQCYCSLYSGMVIGFCILIIGLHDVPRNGLTLAQSRDLDRAQRVAMAAITGRWEPSHSRQLLKLGLEPLGPRRIKLCRTFAQRTAQNSRHTDKNSTREAVQDL